MTIQDARAAILSGEIFLGVELGSTRIKAVLIDGGHTPIATGSHAWENKLVDGVWTYDLADVWRGLAACYERLAANVVSHYGVELTTVKAMGVSGMMHGYLAFDRAGKLLTPFRTWRNTITGEASEALTKLFGHNIPERWSIAHLYQSMLLQLPHVKEVAYLTTLSGYIHWQLTGEQVLGIGDASGMFPIDNATRDFHAGMVKKFDGLAAEKGYELCLRSILPTVRAAGADAGRLSEAGARLIDPSGVLKAGIPLCPPEGDAGTGMVATNSVAPRTGNVSAGTSVFTMTVLEKPLSRVYPQVDMVTTPAGDPVAMVHGNNCTGDLDAWVGLFREALAAFGQGVDPDRLYGVLFAKALEGAADCGGLLAYNYLSGEHITGFQAGRPLFVRGPESAFTLPNFMRVHLYTALGAIHTGMNILFEQEGVTLDAISGHGGLFKAAGAGQAVMAAALNTPVTVMETAGEGGPWGMAILAAYGALAEEGESLGDYLAHRVFEKSAAFTTLPSAEAVEGFQRFMQRYHRGLAIERAAVDAFLQ